MKANISPSELDNLKRSRWLARTDLFWLAKDVLNYSLMDERVHKPVMATLQKFSMPNRAAREASDIVTPYKIQYTPMIDMYSLIGSRQNLILDPRSWYKTTGNVICHSIQWLLNFPQAQIAIIQSTDKKAQDFLNEIKNHFKYNAKFRAIFPDFVPHKRIDDFGTALEFDLPNRHDVVARIGAAAPRQGNIMAGAIEKGMAGYHFDVIKFSDIVDDENSKSALGRMTIFNKYSISTSLKLRPDSWIDMEGTRYHFDDLYGRIIDNEDKLQPFEKQWKIFVRGAYMRDLAGAAPQFTPDELRYPFLKIDGQFVSNWPEMWPVTNLENERKMNEPIFIGQKLNDPSAAQDESKPFPINKETNRPLNLIPREHFAKIPIAFTITTVDTAETQGTRSDFSVITTAGVGKDGKYYVFDIQRGKWLSDELITKIMAVNTKYRPLKIMIEETAYVRGLKASLGRAKDKSYFGPIHVPLVFIKRDNQATKHERILNGLQPFYSSGDIRFVDGSGTAPVADSRLVGLSTDVLIALAKELEQTTKYSLGSTDDILDTLSDLFQDREWFGREGERQDEINDEARQIAANLAFKKMQDLEFKRNLGILPFDDPEAAIHPMYRKPF